MKRILILVLLVIVLVSLNWFRGLMAQDLSNLSDEQLAELLKRTNAVDVSEATLRHYRTPKQYRTPPVFDQRSETAPAPPAGSEAGLPSDSGQVPVTVPDPPGTLVPFEELKPFGLNLFGRSSEITTPIDIASAADYVLGPSDNVIIYVWGRVDREYNLTLDREGRIYLPKAGDIVAWGLTLEQFTDRVKDRLSKVYSEFELTVSLGKIRSMRIYVTGEVRHPGAYTVSSLTSVLNVLFSAGGPNERGSLRNISVMRSGQPVATIDLYDFLLKGDNSNDIRLQTGDAVFVPVAGARVAIRGEVNRSAIYELKGGESVCELITLAGRTTPEAYLDRVMLERVEEDGEWHVIDLDLSRNSETNDRSEPLTDGDRFTIFSIFDARENKVAVFGQVQHPGYYERNDSTRVSDLLERGQLKRLDVYLTRADIFRRYADRRTEIIAVDLAAVLAGQESADATLCDGDSLHVYSINEVKRDRYVFIEGEVQRPGRYPLYDKMTVEDLIFLAGSYNRGADQQRAELARIDPDGLVSLSDLAMNNPGHTTLKLQEEDHLYVRLSPQWLTYRSVTVEGEVVYPGEYLLASRNETLFGLIKRCGGFTLQAFPRGIILERPSIGRSLARLNIADKLQRSSTIVEDSLGQVVKQEAFDYNLASVNRIIVDIDRLLATKGAEGDVVLEPGDRLTVPPRPAGISVMGAVASNGTLSFQQNSKAKSYIQRAGGFTKQADKKGTRLIRAWGEVVTGGVMGKKVEMGDVLVVPMKIEKDRNWLKTMSTMLTATTGILTSVYLISKL